MTRDTVTKLTPAEREQRRRELNAQYARRWRERNPEAQIRSQIKSLQRRLEKMEREKREAAGE